MRFDHQPRRNPILVIHLPPEHKASPDQHWISLTQVAHGWSVETSLPGDSMYLGPSKCGFAPDRITAESKAISAAIEQGVAELYVEG